MASPTAAFRHASAWAAALTLLGIAPAAVLAVSERSARSATRRLPFAESG